LDATPHHPPPSSPAASPPAADPSAKRKKKKVRGAWISFVGRIVAQIIGAVASVVLGVLILQKVNQPQDKTSDAAAADPVAVSIPRESGEVALAVLPLDNFSGDQSQDYFADGMTEALTADLAQIAGLHVISRTSTMAYKGRQKPLPQIARELGVDLIVEGSVVQANDRVRVTAQLIDAKTDRHLWARSYERRAGDVLALQAEVATAIAREIKGAINPAQTQRLAARRAVDPAVYDLYLRGRHAWNMRTRDGYDSAIRYFTEATQKDPEFALAYAGLADVYVLEGAPIVTGVPDERMNKARAAAERAVALDPQLAEAHTSRAAVHFFGGRDYAAAERAFKQALAINPHYPTARQWYAIVLAEQRRDREALEHAEEAVRLDPLSGTMQQTLALVHYYGRRFDAAIASAQRAIALNAQLPLARNVAAKALIIKGEPHGAVGLLEPAAARTSEGVMLLALAHERAGNRMTAASLIRDLQSRQPAPLGVLAQWHAATGNADEAFRMLARLEGPPPPVIRIDPLFDQFRADARYAAL
jgi:TolB-like protein/Tfp pilus assembly protein PilF